MSSIECAACLPKLHSCMWTINSFDNYYFNSCIHELWLFMKIKTHLVDSSAYFQGCWPCIHWATIIVVRIVAYAYYLVKCVNWFLLTLNTIDILCSIHSNFCANKILFQVHKRLIKDLSVSEQFSKIQSRNRLKSLKTRTFNFRRPETQLSLDRKRERCQNSSFVSKNDESTFIIEVDSSIFQTLRRG